MNGLNLGQNGDDVCTCVYALLHRRTLLTYKFTHVDLQVEWQFCQARREGFDVCMFVILPRMNTPAIMGMIVQVKINKHDWAGWDNCMSTNMQCISVSDLMRCIIENHTAVVYVSSV